MINSNTSALGVLFPNSFDALVPDLVNVRNMASIPFASRYRMIDFTLSGMVNSGISNISILVKNNYNSLMDHLGSGREWDLTRKNGGLHIFPPFAEKNAKVFTGRIEGLANVLNFLRSQTEKYVVISDCNVALNFDYDALIKAHIKSGADVTIAYTESELPEAVFKNHTNDRGFYYTYNIDENGRIQEINVNSRERGVQNFSLNIFVVERELLIKQVDEAFVRGLNYYERDILLPKLNEIFVNSFKYDGYVARISDLKSYFDENMKLLKDENLDALFSGTPIYTKIRDDNPTRYINGACVKNAMLADGCVIEGEVENSILFRGVRIAKGAKVKNCILMQDTVVEAGAELEYVITDKSVTVTADKTIKCPDTYPGYIAKGHTV